MYDGQSRFGAQIGVAQALPNSRSEPPPTMRQVVRPIAPPHRSASTSLLDRSGFLIGAGAAGMAVRGAIDVALHAGRSGARPHSPDCATPAGTRSRKGHRDICTNAQFLVRSCVFARDARSASISATTRTSMTSSIGTGCTASLADGAMEEGSADGAAWSHRALYLRAETDRDAVVSQPRRCRKRPDAKSLFGNVWLPDRRTDERCGPVTTGKSCSQPTTGKARGEHARHPQGSAAGQRPGGLYASASFNDRDARPRRTRPRARGRACAVSPAQCEPDREHHAGAAGPSLYCGRARRKHSTRHSEPSTRCFSHLRNVPM